MAQKRITDLDEASALTSAELLEVSQLSDDVTITATTISATASDNSFNDSANGFVTAGFGIGDRVRVQGFTGNVVNNLYVGIVTALTTGKMTIGGTDGDVIVDDAAGESVTISKWTSRRIAISDLVNIGKASGATVQTEVADYTIDPDDAGHYIRLTAGGTKDVTVEPDSTTALPANAEWHFRNIGAGDATFVEGSGVTITPPNGGTLVVPQDGTVTLKRVAADTFELLGQTVAV
jgi:hypothetical protein